MVYFAKKYDRIRNFKILEITDTKRKRIRYFN